MEHKLKNAIYKTGYNINDFCSLCGINPSVLYHYFSGKKKSLRGSTIYTLAENLHMSYEEVLNICPPRV